MTAKNIVRTPGTVGGKARFDGTRLSIRFMLEMIHHKWTDQSMLENYPSITQSDVDYLRSIYKDLQTDGQIKILSETITLKDVDWG